MKKKIVASKVLVHTVSSFNEEMKTLLSQGYVPQGSAKALWLKGWTQDGGRPCIKIWQQFHKYEVCEDDDPQAVEPESVELLEGIELEIDEERTGQ